MGNRRHRQREPGALNGKELAATIPQRTATEPLFAAAREAREPQRRGGATTGDADGHHRGIERDCNHRAELAMESEDILLGWQDRSSERE